MRARGRATSWAWLLLAVCAALIALYQLWPRSASTERMPAFELTELMAGDAEGFARAVEPRRFDFPRDHGPHPDYRTEWWYFTGNLASADGRAFGFEFTIFRFALAPEPVSSASAWATRQAYMAHLAITDIDGRRFQAWERFARGGLELAGARAEPFAVWLEDWRVTALGEVAFPARLEAAVEEAGLSLRLDALQAPVLQGEEGLSRKGATPGNASYYYSMPRLAAEGELRLGDERYEVQGQAWLDREWGSSALERGQEGWDWFSLQFADGSEMMLYRLRHDDGSVDALSAATWIAPDGEVRRLSADDFELVPVEHWQSPATGARYPLRWRLRIPALAARLDIVPRLEAQELDLSVRYWEGAVEATGEFGGEPAHALGYMELTGYE